MGVNQRGVIEMTDEEIDAFLHVDRVVSWDHHQLGMQATGQQETPA